MFLYASDTHLWQTLHTVFDPFGTYRNIVLAVLYPFSNFSATYEEWKYRDPLI